MEKIYFGIDISTTCIGLSLYKYNDENKNGEVIYISGFTPKINNKIKGIESLCLKKYLFEDELLRIKELINLTYKGDKKIDKVIIEEPLLGSNNVNTVATLLRFNGMISESIYKNLEIVPEYISSYDARKYAFPELMSLRKFNKKGEIYPLKDIQKAMKRENRGLVLFGEYVWDIDKKQIILDKITDKFPNIDWVFDKNGKLIKSNFDGADSLAAILGYINKEKYKDMELTIVNMETDENSIKYNTSFGDDILWKHKITLI